MKPESKNNLNGKWHYIYYAIAGIDLITIAAALILSHSILDIYKKSVATDRAWAQRSASMVELGELASRVNLPGNRIFENGRFDEESENLREYYAEFNAAFHLLNEDIQSNVEPENQAQLLLELNNVKQEVDSVEREARQIFGYLNENDSNRAGEKMASMDQHFSNSLNSLAKTSRFIGEIQSKNFELETSRAENLSYFEYLISGMILTIILIVAVYGHLTAIRMRRASIAIEQNEAQLRSIISSSMDGIVSINPSLGIIECNRSIEKLLQVERADLIGHSLDQFLDDQTKIEMLAFIETSKNASQTELFQKRFVGSFNGQLNQVVPVEFSIGIGKSDGKPVYNLLVRDISESIKLEKEQAKLQKEQLETARFAGMADVATSVLHNIGNALNSINVSLNCVRKYSRNNDRIDAIKKITHLFEEASNDDAENSRTRDPQKIARLLNLKLDQFSDTDQQINRELELIFNHVEHVKKIVQSQQKFAKTTNLLESVHVEKVVREAISFESRSLKEHGVTLTTRTEPLPNMIMDRHSVLQILLNLIKNAKESVLEAAVDNPQIDVEISAHQGEFEVTVSDNGVGIRKENLSNIFRQGFSTKMDGHGFGLHGSANTAIALGGRLTVTSEGSGRGASFSLRLPIKMDFDSVATDSSEIVMKQAEIKEFAN